MKILLLDIESAPALGWVWQLFNQNLSPKHVAMPTYVLSWAAKWYGTDKIMYESVQYQSQKSMMQKMHRLLDEADVVVHYYGSKFDIPMLNTEFVKLGMRPPSPYKQVDLKKVVADTFRFPSNKLEYVVKALGIGQKIETDFKLWLGCIDGNKLAWHKMGLYNRHDVHLLVGLYDVLKPWIKNHPNHGTYGTNKEVCPNCGSGELVSRGFAKTKFLTYRRFHCRDCGHWSRSSISETTKRVKRVVSAS